jgi:hypothetical protein
MPALASARTVVSIEFDDGIANQIQADSALSAHDMHGTFFIPDGLVGSPGYMTWSQIHTLASDGNEIGGHTISHPHLASLEVSEQQREVCNDRVRLLNQGFAVTDFAYPFASHDATIEAVVAHCGYNSGRIGSGVGLASDCAQCVVAESIPPTDPYATRTPFDPTSSTPLSTIEGYVTNAEQNGGGWVQLTFHNLCDGCDQYAITPADFNSLLDWLAGRAAAGTVVQTVTQVIGGPLQPAVLGPPAPPPSGPELVSNPSLESNDSGGGVAECFQLGGYGVNNRATARTADAHTGLVGVQLSVSGYVSGDAKVLTRMDGGSCTPALNAGTRYRISAWYKSSAATQFVLYVRDALGDWSYWSTSAPLAAAGDWTQATWMTPPLPAGDTGISFGLSLATNGTLTTDDYSMGAIASPAPGAELLQNPSLEATDANGVPWCWQIVNPGVSTAAWQHTTDAHSGAAAEQVQISSLTSGDQELVSRQDEGSCAPTGSPAQTYTVSGWYKSDQPPAWIAYYHIPGVGWSIWGQSSQLSASAGYTRATWTTPPFPAGADLISVGMKLQRVGTLSLDDLSLRQVDSTPPTVTLTSPAPGLLRGGVALHAAAADDFGVDHVDFLLDGRTIATSAASPYGASWDSSGVADGPHSLSARAVDAAGNSTVTSETVTVDNTPPSSSAIAPSRSATSTLSVSYSAADATSGLARVDLYAEPPGASGYAMVASDASGNGAGSFSYTATAGDGDYRFYTVATDRAGNVEAPPTTSDATTRLDTTPPTSRAGGPAYSAARHFAVPYVASDGATGVGVASVELWAKAPNASGYTRVTTLTSTAVSGVFAYTAAGPEGAYRFYTIAVDQLGHRQAAPLGPDATTVLDTVSPGPVQMRTPTSPLTGTLTLSPLQAPTDTGSGVARVLYEYRRSSSSPWISACSSAAPPWSCDWTVSAAGGGWLGLRATVADRAGNESVSTTVWAWASNGRSPA